jgi:mitochondrial inner membrane protease subunit 1
LAHRPGPVDVLVCKRIVAGPGDTVIVPLSSENRGAGCHVERMVVVPTGHVWLTGDNVPMSSDSRSFGPLPCQMLAGRLFLQVCLVLFVL